MFENTRTLMMMVMMMMTTYILCKKPSWYSTSALHYYIVIIILIVLTVGANAENSKALSHVILNLIIPSNQSRLFSFQLPLRVWNCPRTCRALRDFPWRWDQIGISQVMFSDTLLVLTGLTFKMEPCQNALNPPEISNQR